MFALVYVSHSVTPFDDAALKTLAEKASEKNGRLQVTGYLNFNRARSIFFQYLEGPQRAVVDLMTEIEADDRHRIANVVKLGDIQSRLFPDWSMRYLDAGFFHMIRMEEVLETVLLTMSERTFDRELIVATVMRLAKRIASRQQA